MGDFRVRKIVDANDRKKMYQHALDDINAFEFMLRERMFDYGPLKIGAEQELCIVNNEFDPASSALKILNSIKDKRYTNELALFNLEINLDPHPLSGNCFSEMENSLLGLLQLGYTEANKRNEHILMAGILPTLKYRHLQFDYMTPVKRYETLSREISDLRGADFEIYLQGVDDLIMSLGSVLFEACNTSFQLHLQINPDEFVDKHNWSQMIAGPVLSACTNSPMLFGNELWAETRIALFKQSLDTRSAQKFMRKKLPRVYFGKDWLQHSAAEMWKQDLMQFPLIVTSDDFENPMDVLSKGGIPKLRAIRLHNGTTYTWNRLCYGPSKDVPHLRIECRYLPSGPSAIDEIANFAFWIGLMNAEPEHGCTFWKNMDFRVVKNNFIKAARTGMNTVFQWCGENIPAKNLILEKLMPMAREGLESRGVNPADIDKYLMIFERRVKAEITGTGWTVKNFRILSEKYGSAIAQKEIVRQMLNYQRINTPVHEWVNVDIKSYQIAKREPTVEELMTIDIFSVHDYDSIELVESILSWNNIHHLPVENRSGDLVGVITDGMIERNNRDDKKDINFAEDIMLSEPCTVRAYDRLSKALEIMSENNLNGLPVVYEKKLVGIITKTDILKKSNRSSSTLTMPLPGQ